MKDKGLRLVKYGLCILGMIMFSFLAGCAKEEKDLLEKIKDLEFTVLEEDKIISSIMKRQVHHIRIMDFYISVVAMENR